MSDLHLGHRQYGLFDREQDFYKQLDKCVKELNKHKCDTVIIAGDIFDKPNPSPEAIHQYIDKISKIKAKNIIAIKGNHTMLLRDNHYPVDRLVADESGMDHYHLLEDDIWEDDNILINGITYRGASDINEFIELQKKMASDIHDTDSFNILVVHQAFKEFCGFTGEELSIKDIDYTPFNVIICGHIHSPIDTKIDKDTIFIQPGSIERLNTEEARDEQAKGKGIYTIDTKTKKCTFHKVKCTREFIFGTFNAKKEETEPIIQKLQNKINKCKEQPILAVDFHDADTMWDSAKTLNNVLINNSKVKIEETELDTTIITESEIPPVQEAVKQIATRNLQKKEATLCIELYEALNNDKDAMDILKKFEEKNYENKTKPINIPTKETEEIYEYFEKLGVR